MWYYYRQESLYDLYEGIHWISPEKSDQIVLFPSGEMQRYTYQNGHGLTPEILKGLWTEARPATEEEIEHYKKLWIFYEIEGK